MAGLIVALSAFLFFCFRRFSVPVPLKLRLVLAGVRALLVGLLFFIVLDPYWDRPSHSEWLGVLVDTSKSMGIEEKAGKSRLQTLQDFFAHDAFWGELKKNKLRQIFSFDTSLREPASLSDLKADGQESRLLSALREIDDRYRQDPNLVGWIVFTDGAATDRPGEGERLIQSVSFPWIFVGVGENSEVPNLHLEAPLFEEPVFTGDQVSVTLKWTSHFPRGTSTRLSMKLDGKHLTEKEISLDGGTTRLEFSVKEEGTHFLDIALAPLAGEGSVVDNAVRVAFKVHPRQIRVFYAESFYKNHNFFKEGLEEDSAFKVTFASSLIGFSRKYQVPFFKDPLYGFPHTREELFRYDVIVLSDVKRNLLTEEQMDWIREWVEEEGGALVMIGGMDSFGDGGYAGTPIEKMLPVEISEEYKQSVFIRARGTNENPFRPVFSPGAQKHPLLQLAGDSEKNRLLWETIPLLGGYNYVGRLKPGATGLLQHPVDTSAFGPRVILAVQEFGKGKVLAFTSDVTPNWGEKFQDWKDEKEGWLYAQFWRHVLKGLTEERLKRKVSWTQIQREPAIAESSQPIHWRAALSLKAGERPGGSLTFEIGRGSRKIKEERFEDLDSPEISWKVPPLEAGDYFLKATYDPGGGKESIRVESPFVVHSPRLESRFLSADPPLLSALAKETEGVHLPFKKSEDLNKAISRIRKIHLRRHSKPFWNHPLIYLLLLALLGLDWFLRKKKGVE